MKVSFVKELLSHYSDDDELMVIWNDIDNFEYILDKPLPKEVWSKAVKYFNRADMQDFNDTCHYLVITAKDEVEETN